MKRMVQTAIIERGAELSGLPATKVERMIQDIWKVEGREHYDTFLLFRYAERKGYYQQTARRFKDIAALRCLTLLDEVQAEAILSKTVPPGNIIHALERLHAECMLLEYQYSIYLVQYLLGCSVKSAMAYAPNCDSVLAIIDTTRRNRYIDDLTADIALHGFCFLLDPMVINRILCQEKIKSDNFESLANFIKSKGLGSTNMARIRRWQPIPRDEIQEVFDHGRDSTEKETKDEIYIRRLMRKHGVDRMDAFTTFHDTQGNMDQADQVCTRIAKHGQERLAQSLPIVPTRDTRRPPNATPRTRVVAVLGLHEDAGSTSACPSIGDGWMVSDFYLWMHILHGMGKSQEWITSLEPRYLIEKYGKEDKVSQEQVDTAPDVWKPVQTKWASGFVHGDPWEERVVVLDEDTLPFAEKNVTIGPGGVALRGFFLHRLEQTFAEAAKSQDPVLILMFAHGDFESSGGLYIGTEFDSTEGVLSPEKIAEIHAKYPNVRVTLYMTSCYSGHWVETVEFQGNNKPTVLAAAEPDQEAFGFAWSNSQRHAGGLFSTSTITELLREPAELPPDADEDTSREYKDLTSAILSQMYRLCLPGNIPDYGSTPVFSAPKNQEKFYERTGYALYDYKSNYGRLKKIPASDPHPKRDRKRFEGGLADSSHPDIIAWEQRHPGVVDDEYPEATAGYGSTKRGLKNKTNMAYLISCYMRSQKGSAHYYESKMVMDRIRAYNQHRLDPRMQVELRRVLVSRLVLNKFANQYSEALGLYKLPPIEEWDVSEGKHAQTYTIDTFNHFTRILMDSRIFHIFDKQTSPFYRRPAQYLAASMGSAGYNESDVVIAIKTLHRLISEKSFTDSIAKHYLRSAGYSRSISRLSGLLKTSWDRSRTGWASQYHGNDVDSAGLKGNHYGEGRMVNLQAQY